MAHNSTFKERNSSIKLQPQVTTANILDIVSQPGHSTETAVVAQKRQPSYGPGQAIFPCPQLSAASDILHQKVQLTHLQNITGVGGPALPGLQSSLSNRTQCAWVMLLLSKGPHLLGPTRFILPHLLLLAEVARCHGLSCQQYTDDA